jgi:molybdenum cofactor cytidylyltransferase
MIAAVVLAAGESKRMGVPKLLLPFGRTTIIETVLAGVTASKVDAAFVVLGSGRRAIRAKIRKFSVAAVVNERFHEGMLSSIQKGIASLPPQFQAALIVLGDQPGLSPAVIDALVAASRGGKKGLTIPVYGGKRGHPLLLDLKYRKEVARLSPATGLRGLLDAHPEDILYVDFPDAPFLIDIDTPEDYHKAHH